MIKQDNRPKSETTFETRLNSLKELLNEPAEQHKDETVENPSVASSAKLFFISVTGNNNIISTEKSQNIFRNKKRTFISVAGLFFCLLFF